jgi:heme/copper-type cytochrome/quinol oxidase subunit 4
MSNFYQMQDGNQDGWIKMQRKSSSFLIPIIVSIVGVLAWLIYILLFALYWSKGYNLFQDIVVLFATLFITAIVIGLVWLIWGRNHWHWHTRGNW